MVDDDDSSGVGVGGSPEAMAVNQDTKTVYILDWDSNTVSVISIKNNTKIGEDIPWGQQLAEE